jgi:hypothetical protein
MISAAKSKSEAPINVAPDDNPINELEPDLIALKRETGNFASGNPQPTELLIEVRTLRST